jgi:hypothetical protein
MSAVTKQEIIDGLFKCDVLESLQLRKRIQESGVSDGYHTFEELYDHRCLLFINLCMAQPRKCAYKIDPNFEGWPALYLELPCGQISYHVPAKFLPLFQNTIERDDNYFYDGHKSEDVLEQLKKTTMNALQVNVEAHK